MDRVFKFLTTNSIRYEVDYPTFKLSSFELGGNAKIVAFPSEIQELCDLLSFLRDSGIRFYLLGRCTNTFFSENGFDGVIVSTTLLDKVFCENNLICATCGALITDLSLLALKNSLSDMEFCLGIPGSVGGAMCMNASAFDMSISDIVLESDVFDVSTGKRFVISREEHLFERKRSIFSKDTNLVLLKTKFILEEQDKSSIYAKMRQIALKRISSQPLDKGSCGSAFKRPIGGYASKLIDDANLKGFRVGNVAVSQKHAGFVVNLGCGKSYEIIELNSLIKEKVLKEFGITLEEEFIFVE